MTATRRGSRSIDHASRRVALHLATGQSQIVIQFVYACSNHLPDGHASCVRHRHPAVGSNFHAGHVEIDAYAVNACVNHLATSQELPDNHLRSARSDHLAASHRVVDAQRLYARGNTSDNQTKGQQ